MYHNTAEKVNYSMQWSDMIYCATFFLKACTGPRIKIVQKSYSTNVNNNLNKPHQAKYSILLEISENSMQEERLEADSIHIKAHSI